ncbi:MAG: hypothetical protein BGO81_17430 [Devosia sp. 66-22]|nr:hypothetical protein [Devosia sp. 66-22]OJX48486.1 MAG: hypothetical protein BGO81_17430 [Devosia sp. 66-22]
MIGLNHGSWSVRHLYEGKDVLPLLEEAYGRLRDKPDVNVTRLRLLRLAVEMQSIPADYFQYYYYRDEIVRELSAKATTRAQDILAKVPDYWQHYVEQAASDAPKLDPQRSRGGIHELELAIDAMDAIFNDRGDVLPVNCPNHGALTDFPDDLVVEMRGRFDRHGVDRIADGRLPRHVVGLVEMLGEYQAAENLCSFVNVAFRVSTGRCHRVQFHELTSEVVVQTIPAVAHSRLLRMRPYIRRVVEVHQHRWVGRRAIGEVVEVAIERAVDHVPVVTDHTRCQILRADGKVIEPEMGQALPDVVTAPSRGLRKPANGDLMYVGGFRVLFI